MVKLYHENIAAQKVQVYCYIYLPVLSWLSVGRLCRVVSLLPGFSARYFVCGQGFVMSWAI